MKVEVRRIYDDPGGTASEYRVLVDRLWPRGVRKDAVQIDDWVKDVAPSSELRKWYGHDPARFDEFARRYQAELSDSAATEDLRRRAKGRKVLVLLTATKDVEHSGAAVLAGVLRG